LSPQDRITRAEQAKQITESPVFTEAKDELLKAIRGLRLQVSPRDLDGAHKLVLMEQAVEKTHQFLTAFIQDGDIAKAQLAEEFEPPKEQDESLWGKTKRKFRAVV
jgi:hypothetical protein